MTLTIELPPQEELVLRAKAARLGMPVERYAREMLLRVAEEGDAQQEVTDARRAAFNRLVDRIHSQADQRAEAELPPLDLSGSRGDVYGYTEREDAQR